MPLVEQLAQEYQGKIKVGKLNVFDNVEIAASHGVTHVPTILIFRDGSVSHRSVGFQPYTVLQKALRPFVSSEAS